MKRLAIFLSVLALMTTTCVCCTNGSLSQAEPAVKTDYIYADASSASDILKTLTKSGYTIFSIDETTSSYWLTFTEFPKVTLPDGTVCESDQCAVSKQAADSYVIRNDEAYIHMKNGTSIRFNYRTNTNLELLEATAKASYVIESIVLKNEKYVITFKEHPPVSLLRVYPEGIASISLDKEDITYIEEHTGKTTLTVSDGKTLVFGNALTKNLYVSVDDILFEEPTSIVEVRFALEGFDENVKVSVSAGSDRVKASVNMDQDNKGGKLTLVHQDNHKWKTKDYTAEYIDTVINGVSCHGNFSTMTLTEFDETYVTLTAQDEKVIVSKSIRTMYDDLMLNTYEISAICWDMGYGRQIKDAELVMSKLGITTLEKNTWYEHVTRNRGYRTDDNEHNSYFGVITKTSKKLNQEDLIIEYDHKYDGWFTYEFLAESTTPNLQAGIYTENDSNEIKIVTITLHRKGSKKYIHLKKYFDYRDCYEIYGMEKFNPENSFLDNPERKRFQD